ncbi:hypothetical protein [Pacificoceanicola onchidii]|uniref:hypothetical protein n=1 Tax=Pacificoceanicola onchidii TaxID=2562685 RepID=UPI0010A66CD6|nr:hypothetical protein [Pacificoceanicola onchidii]
MPLHLLVPLVVGGIFAIMIATVLMGMNKPRRFETDKEAVYAWSREYPRASVLQTSLAANKSAALIRSEEGLGLVWAIGADSTARFLAGAVVSQTVTGLTLELPDYAAPGVQLELEPDEARDWAAQIGEIG